METREKRRLTNPAGDLRGDTSPAFSPDGSRLVFNREHVIVAAELYVLYLGENYSPKGEPKRLDTGNVWNLGAAWTPDGQEILISSGIYPMPGLWRMEVLKQGKPVKLNLPYDNIWAPSISRLGKRLAYSVGTNDSNIWRVNMEGAGWKPSRPVPFIASTKFEAEPAFSPDGRRVAFISSQFGPREIWMCDSDGRNPVQLTSMNADLQGPRWSPDGLSIAFAAEAKGNPDIYVVSVNGGAPRRLTTQQGIDYWPYWSRDGQWLYFKSQRLNDRVVNIWKMPSQSGEAIQITHTLEGADVPQESPDKKFLYYCRRYPFVLSVWRMPIDGGKETKLLDSAHPNALWTVRQDGIYYFTPPDGKGISTLCLYEFTSGKTKRILETERRLADVGNVAISPNGRTIIYSQWDQVGSDLMLVENFK